MKCHFASVATATTLLLSVYACSTSDPAKDAPDGGLGPGQDGSSEDSPNNPDARSDGQTNPDSATDAALDADAKLDAEVDAGPAVVRFLGRFDMAAVGGPKVAWPGARIIARFNGTEVKATFADTMLFTDYGANRWEVFIDGASRTILQLGRPGPTTYTLATALVPGPHTVELYKLTEGSVGTTQFQGFDFAGGVLLPPPLPKTRHLQFLADSSSNGYGVDGVEPCDFTAATQNERKSYPALLAQDLDADHHNLSASGKGITQNLFRPDPDVFPFIYQRVGISAFTAGQPTKLWSAADYTPDVVWMALGGNDYGDDDDSNAPDPPAAGVFQTKYDELVATVRTQHPNAHIFCSVAPSLSDAFPTGYNTYTSVKTAAQSAVATRVGAGDTKIYFFEFTRSVFGAGGDTTACDGHVNIAKHRAMADEAKAVIKLKTGW
jgi:hypothetical protein